MAMSEKDTKRAKFLGYVVLVILVVILFGQFRKKKKAKS